MLSSCGDRRLLSSCLSPHRICTLICIRELANLDARFAELLSPSLSTSTVVNYDNTRKRTYIAVYKLTRCIPEAATLPEFLSLLCTYGCDAESDFTQAVRTSIKSSVLFPIDGILDLFGSLPILIGGSHAAAVGPGSPFGVYCRQCVLAFNRLELGQVDHVGMRLTSFVESQTQKSLENGNSLPSFDGEPTVFQRFQPFSNSHVLPVMTSYLSHHLDLVGKSFYGCSMESLISYFSRNFKNRLPDIVLKDWSQPANFQAVPKSKVSLCSSRFETILLAYTTGIAGDLEGCRSLLMDATRQCHAVGDAVGIELCSLLSLLIFGSELCPNTHLAPPPQDVSWIATAMPLTSLTQEGEKHLFFVRFLKCITAHLRVDDVEKRQINVSAKILAMVNSFLPIIEKSVATCQPEIVPLGLLLSQSISIIYRINGEASLAALYDVTTMYSNAEFAAGLFYATAPILRAWQDLLLCAGIFHGSSGNGEAFFAYMSNRVDELFPNQPSQENRLLSVGTCSVHASLMAGRFSVAQRALTELYSLSGVAHTEATVLYARFLLETGQFPELTTHLVSAMSTLNRPNLAGFRLEIIKGLGFIATGDMGSALNLFNELENVKSIPPSLSCIVLLYKCLVLAKLSLFEKARRLLSQVCIMACKVHAAGQPYIVAQSLYLYGVCLSSDPKRLLDALSQYDLALKIFGELSALPALLMAAVAAAATANAAMTAASSPADVSKLRSLRNSYAHKFKLAREQLADSDRLAADCDVWKLSPFYFELESLFPANN